MHPDDHDRLRYAITRSAVDLTAFDEEFRIISASGVVRWFRSPAPRRRMANGDVVWDGFALEITDEKAATVQAAFLALHDSLTGLSNRARFVSSLSKAIETISPDEERIGIFFIDIDAFQDVNDTLGQSAGDDVLRAVGQRLEEFAGSVGTVGRLGGDEFALMLPAIPVAQSAASIATMICRGLTHPMQILGRELVVQVCVGSTIFPHPRDPFQSGASDLSSELMYQANLALHAAKQEGHGTHRTYAAELDDRARDRTTLRQSLHRAILEQEFELHYHPMVELSSGRIVGVESLVRWKHPDLGLQRPDLFIPLAEASGLIVPLGAWIMGEAMRQGQAWRRLGINTPRMAINVSSVQLQKPGFIAAVEQVLIETGADPRDFEFELTEGILIEASPRILDIMNMLKSFGFGIAIDDFGTGHATFKYLRDFPVDKVKIDQTFVRKLVIDSSDAVIVRAMIALADGLGIKIVAEGIETAMQCDFLRDEGCKVGQGYLFSLPLTAEDFRWMLEAHVTLPISTKYAIST